MVRFMVLSQRKHCPVGADGARQTTHITARNGIISHLMRPLTMSGARGAPASQHQGRDVVGQVCRGWLASLAPTLTLMLANPATNTVPAVLLERGEHCDGSTSSDALDGVSQVGRPKGLQAGWVGVLLEGHSNKWVGVSRLIERALPCDGWQ